MNRRISVPSGAASRCAACVLLTTLGLLGAASPALAGGGEVLPASATPKGYSLAKIAAATAVYNTGVQNNNPATPPPPKVPFQVLVPAKGDISIPQAGTMIYLPIFNWDDSPGVEQYVPLPKDFADQEADADYLLDSAEGYISDAFGAPIELGDFFVEVDGQKTYLGEDYITGVITAPLLDGTPVGVTGGTHFVSNGAFLTPLTPGRHALGIGAVVNGVPIVFVHYSVVAK